MSSPSNATPASPYLFLDIDGVLHGTFMKYGYERTCRIIQAVPREDVHPVLRPRKYRSGGGRQELPDWVSRRRPPAATVRFNTPVRVSKSLLEDLDSFGLDVRMLTTWLEHDSVDFFFDQGPVPAFAYSKLTWPGRDWDDPTGAYPANWKIEQLRKTMREDPRPFIWADDAEVPIWGKTVDEEFADIPHLLLAPLDGVGLTRAHVDEVREFLGSL